MCVAALAAGSVLFGASAPPASAQPPCSDAEVIFARGTAEAPGLGGVGQSFVDNLRGQLGAKSLGVYAVNYPASNDFGGGIQFATTVIQGITDAGAHVRATSTACPDTRIVLGGFSQGAVVAGFVTSAAVPPGVPVESVPGPLPSEVADHVAAVVLFGKPSDRFMQDVGAPPIVIGPLYAPKTIELCAPADTICDGSPVGGPTGAHGIYPFNGMTAEGATFAVDRINQA